MAPATSSAVWEVPLKNITIKQEKISLPHTTEVSPVGEHIKNQPTKKIKMLFYLESKWSGELSDSHLQKEECAFILMFFFLP
jgi:hypothetical protein